MQTVDVGKIRNSLRKPLEDSHKGENGRLLVIGGSKLFHSSIYWSADVASRIVDYVHFSSPAEENNDLVRQKLKMGFWNGIVIPFQKIDEYIEEDDVVLIGPGMPRDDGLFAGEEPTSVIVNELVRKHPQKKWVIDGGALQVVDPLLLTNMMIVTPHHKEWEGLLSKACMPLSTSLEDFSRKFGGVTVILKGKEDVVGNMRETWLMTGGNAGMTKGGTGDVLAGLVAALYCTHEALMAAQVTSWVMKRAGEKLSERVGTYFNATDLIGVIPEVLKHLAES